MTASKKKQQQEEGEEKPEVEEVVVEDEEKVEEDEEPIDAEPSDSIEEEKWHNQSSNQMTLSELKKFIQSQTAQMEGTTEFEHADPLLKRIIRECQETNIPLWLWNLPHEEHLKIQRETNRNCCLTCKLGWPQRNGKEFPFF